MAADQNMNQVLRDLHAADNTNTGDPPDDIDYFNHTFIENTTYFMQILTDEQFTALRRSPPANYRYSYLDHFYKCPNNCQPYTANRICKNCSWPSSIRHQIYINRVNTIADIHADHYRVSS